MRLHIGPGWKQYVFADGAHGRKYLARDDSGVIVGYVVLRESHACLDDTVTVAGVEETEGVWGYDLFPPDDPRSQKRQDKAPWED